MKGLYEYHSLKSIRYQTMDAGYDYEPIYQQVHRMGQQSIVAYNRRNESEPVGFDKHFAPTCFREHSYRYDSYDSRSEEHTSELQPRCPSVRRLPLVKK